MQNFKIILHILSSDEKKQAIYLLIMILIMAILDTLGVVSILPFMAVLTNPNLVETNSMLKFAFENSYIFGVKTKKEFIFLLGLVVFIIIIVSIAFKALTNYFQTLFITMREYSIGKRLVEGYLNQPYSWFLNRHSADLGKTILSEVGLVIGNGIQPMINLIAHSTVVIAIITLLIIHDPILTLISAIVLGGAYAVIYILTRGYLNKIGHERIKANKDRFTTITEAFGASKEVKLGRLEEMYTGRFADPAKIYARHVAAVRIISQLPRFVVEAVAFGGMLLLSLYFLSLSGSFITAVPVITFYAFAGYRLMPAFHSIYVSFTSLRFAGPALDTLHKDLKNLQPKITNNYNESFKINFKKFITLNKVSYEYPNSSKTVLRNIQIKIPVNSKVGIVGLTGSGKTTMVDIILGLLEINKGTLEVDGLIINDTNRRVWQDCIGYVPQNIFLVDDTVAGNIAFGVPKKDLDQNKIERAAKIASLHEFVINDLPQKYQTIIGERGIRLSGGQRQRIGIARALYNNPKLLILDEATSSLDNITEKVVMTALNNLGNDITVIIIAHRLTTVKNCDTIFLLEKGELKNKGSFNELLKVNEHFRDMQSIDNFKKN